jgi:hypothetical protein
MKGEISARNINTDTKGANENGMEFIIKIPQYSEHSLKEPI